MLSRHHLVWLSAQGWRTVHAAALPEQLPTLLRWESEDWPLTVTRNEADTKPGQICLGLAAPPGSDGPLRIALRAMIVDVARSSAALPLAAVLETLSDAAWREHLSALAEDGARLTLRVCGPLAMQVLTGQLYTSTLSSIDLLFYPEYGAQLRAGLTLLKKYQALLPLAGEIILPDEQAVAWEEWLAAKTTQTRIRVKDQYSVRMTSIGALLARLPCAKSLTLPINF